MGAAKATCGHSEAPSGLLGVIRLVRHFDERNASGQAQLKRLNPLLNLEAPFHMPQQTCAAVHAVCGSVSSFGYSGIIAHAALRGPADTCEEFS